jgi:phage repressor protein C with HTH and peptisase S24 domain
MLRLVRFHETINAIHRSPRRGAAFAEALDEAAVPQSKLPERGRAKLLLSQEGVDIVNEAVGYVHEHKANRKLPIAQGKIPLEISYFLSQGVPMPQPMDAVRKLIVRLAEQRGTDLKNLSQAIGKNDAYLSQFVKRGSPRRLDEETRRKLADALDVPEASLRTGDYMGFRISGSIADGAIDAIDKHDALGDFVFVPEVDVQFAAGGGQVPITGDVRTLWPFPRTFVQGRLQLRPEDLAIVDVVGDSMEPTLMSGDLAMINRADKRVGIPGLFGIWDGDGLVVKRIERIWRDDSEDVHLRLISDNPLHAPYEVPASIVSVVGRVVWFGRHI